MPVLSRLLLEAMEGSIEEFGIDVNPVYICFDSTTTCLPRVLDRVFGDLQAIVVSQPYFPHHQAYRTCLTLLCGWQFNQHFSPWKLGQDREYAATYFPLIWRASPDIMPIDCGCGSRAEEIYSIVSQEEI